MNTQKPKNPAVWSYTAQVSHSLPWNSFASIAGNIDITRAPNQVNTSSLNFMLSKVFHNTQFSLQLTQTKDSEGKTENTALLVLRWQKKQLGGRNSLLTSSYNSQKHSTQVNWQMFPLSSVNDIGIDLLLEHQLEQNQLIGQLDYKSSRLDTSFSYNAIKNRREPTNTQQRSRVTVGTALVYTDGVLAWSRPVFNSFAVFVPHETLSEEGLTLEVAHENDKKPIAVANNWGAAVVPDLSAYYSRKMFVDVPNLPLGYDLGESNFTLLPKYRSGMHITVGRGPGVFLDGILLYKTGEPFSL